MGRVLIAFTKDGDGRHSKLAARPDHPDRDLAPICNEHTPKHRTTPINPVYSHVGG
jgi:hypothetical protein